MKYLENPMIIWRKKFDIRQWILVTDWNPLTIWFYERCYLRFGVEDFHLGNLQNRFIHLTNNSVVKYSKQFNLTEIEGNMWSSEQFAQYLEQNVGYDMWNEKIKPQMKKIVQWSLEAAQDMIDNRKNSFELYGYDFLIDENGIPWLLEVNSSPDLSYSTKITEILVKSVCDDILKVTADYHFAKKKKEVDTGNFTLLMKAKKAEKPMTSFGMNLVCTGTKITK